MPYWVRKFSYHAGVKGVAVLDWISIPGLVWRFPLLPNSTIVNRQDSGEQVCWSESVKRDGNGRHHCTFWYLLDNGTCFFNLLLIIWQYIDHMPKSNCYATWTTEVTIILYHRSQWWSTTRSPCQENDLKNGLLLWLISTLHILVHEKVFGWGVGTFSWIHLAKGAFQSPFSARLGGGCLLAIALRQ